MKKLNLTVLAVICAICMAFGIIMMTNVNMASANTSGTIPTLSATKVMRSDDNTKMLLATAIKDYDDVYEVGYTGIDAEDKIVAQTDKYYTVITSGIHAWAPEDIFAEDWADDEGVGMIVWEINFEIGAEYSFKPYALVGERNGNNALVEPSEEVRVTPADSIVKQYFTVTVDANNGSDDSQSILVPAGTTAAALDAFNFTKENYHYDGWEYFDGSAWQPIDATAEITSSVTVRPAWEIDTYKITFINSDGSEMQSSDVAYGSTPAFVGDPAHPDAANYNYVFTGWDEEIVAVEGAKTYTATYIATKKAISTPAEFFAMNTIKDGTYYLANDISFKNETFEPIGPAWNDRDEFTGTFDGKGYALTNISINNTVGGVFYAIKGATVKNVYAEVTINEVINPSKHTGLVAVNWGGTVSNVYVRMFMNKGTLDDHYGMRLGAVVGSNKGGTVQNCIGEINISSEVANEVCRGLQRLYVGPIAGWNEDNGSVINSYGIKNGDIYGDYEKREITAIKSNDATATGCALYYNAEEMINAGVINSANGFDMNYWSIDEGKLYMGDNLAGMTEFTQNNIGEFFTTINNYLGGYYVLGSDLDFTNVAISSIGKMWTNQYEEFYGTFNGKGYAMTGIKFTESNSNIFFGSAGAIKNVYAEMTVVENISSDAYIGLVGCHLDKATTGYGAGSISNVYSKLIINADITTSRFTGAIAGRAFGSFSNCIGEIVIGSGVSSFADASTIYAYNSGSAPISNCYGICANSSVPASKSGDIGVTNYTSASALVEAVGADITAANGFDMTYWAVDTANKTISFGGKEI